MTAWVAGWTGLVVFSLVAFTALSVLIVVRGLRELTQMFRDLRDPGGKDGEQVTRK